MTSGGISTLPRALAGGKLSITFLSSYAIGSLSRSSLTGRLQEHLRLLLRPCFYKNIIQINDLPKFPFVLSSFGGPHPCFMCSLSAARARLHRVDIGY